MTTQETQGKNANTTNNKETDNKELLRPMAGTATSSPKE